ncbi:polysaccharide pyruvyl transferase family protein [Salegentibacter sp. LM13S]|uniref:polysaccharide pyruvyl transferase family protein n=1 Tax=Salegentibacter lacus TaxID=2873599 RepID=UPI001CCFA4A3|nr:polysaccharide pyruvyl transferase family protein [Salegentibacter lacus]MBZ9632336.1 polysaccharide pyruvyl transferase family protein [Salegentibacter lacus]
MKKSKHNTYREKQIPLFYWSEIKFIFREKENYGDLLSKYLVEKISGKPVKFVQPKKQPWYKRSKTNFLAVGSILHHATKHSIVWGSGIIDHEQEIAEADFRAVRGPQTRGFLLKLGYNCPDVYGDPALLLPKYYNPQVEKKYKIGVVPHYHDYKTAVAFFGDKPGIKVIDLLTMDVEETTREILSCENIISSSLHGLIVAHAYKIPGLWVEFSDKIFGNGIKYQDYFESLKIPFYKADFIENGKTAEELLVLMQDKPLLPKVDQLEKIQKGLLESCPF